jgi:hypothetical protein
MTRRGKQLADEDQRTLKKPGSAILMMRSAIGLDVSSEVLQVFTLLMHGPTSAAKYSELVGTDITAVHRCLRVLAGPSRPGHGPHKGFVEPVAYGNLNAPIELTLRGKSLRNSILETLRD